VIRVHFTNSGSQPHTMHFQGIHIAEMDGVPGSGPGVIYPGQSFSYEFEAGPVGLHLYYSHNYPVSLEIVKGLYGAFIVEPADGWPAVDHEMVVFMNGFDINNDGRNEFYGLNSIPFHYQKHAVPIQVNNTVRLFLLNMVEFDAVNSFHMHGNFFSYYPTGTAYPDGPAELTDTIMLAQGQRGILEFSYALPGLYLFRSQINRFAESGAFGLFQVDF
jgi:FtsP/CotA-like multicopper oxidase with cupredoxin domain